MCTSLVLVVVLASWKTAATSEAFSGQETTATSTASSHIKYAQSTCTVQWLANALVTDDVKKGGGGDRPPLYLKHISSKKKSNFLVSYRDRVSAKNIFPTLACE